MLPRLRRPFQQVAKRFNSSTTPGGSTGTAGGGAGAGAGVPKKPFGYASTISLLHWTMAGGILGVFGCVEIAKRCDKKDPRKGTLMKYHKSFGVLMGGLLLLRFGRRFLFVNKMKDIPGPMDGPYILHQIGNLTHYTMYGLMFFMPVSGIVMGYYSGYGVPFFNMKIPGASEENKSKDIAGKAYKYHTFMGTVFEVMVGLHFGAALFHHFQGHQPFTRMNPFAAGSVGGISAFYFESIEDGYLLDGSSKDDNMNDDDDMYDENWTNDMKLNENNNNNNNNNNKMNKTETNVIFGNKSIKNNNKD